MAQNNDINIKINVNSSQAEKNTSNYKKRVRELTDEMTNLQLAGKENTAQYAAAAKELANIKDAMGDTAAVARTLSDDFFKQRAAMEGLALGANVFSQLTQAAELCGIENENLSKALNRLQAVMNLANTAMNISKALNKDSALMIALRTKNTRALTDAQKANTVATEAGTAATTGLATAEKTATAAAGQLTIGCKAVGTAIKAIPIIGWIATAVSLLMTLKDLVAGFFDEEERGVEIRKEQIKLLDEYNSRLRKVYTAVSNEEDRFNKIKDRLQEVKEGSSEWEDLMNETAQATGISLEYLKEHPKIVDRILDEQHKLNKATQQYNAYQELIQEANEEYEKTRGYWTIKDKDEKEAMRIRSEFLKDQIFSWQRLAAAEELDMDAAAKTMYLYKDIAKNWKKVTDEKIEADKNAADAAQKNQDRIDRYNEESLKEGAKLHKQAQIAMLQEEIDRAQEGTIERIEAEDRLLEYKKKIARQELANQKGWNKLSIEERQALIRESDTKFMNEQRKLWTNYYKELDDKENQRIIAEKQKAKTLADIQVIGLEEGTAAWLEAYQNQLTTEKDLALANAELTAEEKLLIQAEYDQKMADAQKKFEEQQNAEALALFQARFSAMEGIVSNFSNLTTALQDAELEKVGDNERHQADIKKKYAKMNFASQVAAIGIDTAKGIMSVWSTAGEAGPILGPILGAIQTALIAATGIAQTAKAKAAMSKALSGKAAKGAWVTGRSHSDGGELYELEGGEAVLNKKAMAVPAFRNLASAMNQATGGVAFPTNSMTTSTPAISATVSDETIAKIVAGVAAIPVVVTESSITNAQRNVSVIEKRSAF